MIKIGSLVYLSVFCCYFHRLSCSILTSDHKYVAAGSLDSLIYLWERSNLSTESEVNNVLRNSENEYSQNTNSLPSEQCKDYIEL